MLFEIKTFIYRKYKYTICKCIYILYYTFENCESNIDGCFILFMNAKYMYTLKYAYFIILYILKQWCEKLQTHSL